MYRGAEIACTASGHTSRLHQSIGPLVEIEEDDEEDAISSERGLRLYMLPGSIRSFLGIEIKQIQNEALHTKFQKSAKFGAAKGQGCGGPF